MASSLSYYRLDLTSECIDSVKLVRGLRQHLTFADLTSVVMQIGQRQQAYLLLQGCPGCAEGRCTGGCRAMLLNRVIMGAFGTTSCLSLVPKGLAPRTYTRRYTLIPRADAAALDSSILQSWPEVRLALHWHRAQKGAPLVRGVFAAGDIGPDPTPIFENRGWEVKPLRQPFGRWGWMQPSLLRAASPLPLILPKPQPWQSDPMILTVPLGERRIAVDAPPEPLVDPETEKVAAAVAARLDRVVPADTPLRPLPTFPGQQDVLGVVTPNDEQASTHRTHTAAATAAAAAGAGTTTATAVLDQEGDNHTDVGAPLLVFTITQDGEAHEEAPAAEVANDPAKAVLAPEPASDPASWDVHALTEIPDLPYEELCEMVARHLAIIFAGIALWGGRRPTAANEGEGEGEAEGEAEGHRHAGNGTAGAPAARGDEGPEEGPEEEPEKPLLGEGKGAMYRRDLEEFIIAMLSSDAIMHGLRQDRAEGPGIKRKRVAAILKPQHQHHAQRVVKWMENATLIHAADDPAQPDKFARSLQVTDPREMLESMLEQLPQG